MFVLIWHTPVDQGLSSNVVPRMERHIPDVVSDWRTAASTNHTIVLPLFQNCGLIFLQSFLQAKNKTAKSKNNPIYIVIS